MITRVRGVGMVLLFAAATALTTAQIAMGQQRPKLFVAGYGGSFERMMRNDVIPKFEAANNVKVEYVVGTPPATLAKLQAQRNAQEIDVAIMDDGTITQAVTYGFCTSVAPDAAFKSVAPISDIGLQNKAIGFIVGSSGILYNADQFKKLGLPAPTSWLDLGNPAYKGQVGLVGITAVTGMQGLIMMARAAGGGESNIDPGFNFYREKIRPNIVTFAPSAPKIEELMQNGEISITVLIQSRARSLQRQGLSIVMVEPKEGMVANLEAVCPIAKPGAQGELAQKFIRHLFSDDAQRAFAAGGYTPLRTDVALSKTIEDALPVRRDKIGSLARIDWQIVNKNRAEWIQRWNREVER